MALQVRAILSDAGSLLVPNEDLVGYSERTAWVLDGATGLGGRRLLPGLSDAAWLAKHYGKLLQAEADKHDLEKLCKHVIREVAGKFSYLNNIEDLERYELPSAGMAIIRATEVGVELTSLGDCRAMVELPNGEVIPTPPSPLAKLDEEAIAEIESYRQGGRNFDEARAAVQPRLRANRAKMNTPGPEGYWVLSIHPEVADTIKIQTLLLSPGTRVRGLLVTDGFYRLVDTVRICHDEAELIKRTFAEGPGEMLRQLRVEEDADPECVSYRRLKRKDDASVVLFEVTA